MHGFCVHSVQDRVESGRRHLLCRRLAWRATWDTCGMHCVCVHNVQNRGECGRRQLLVGFMVGADFWVDV